MRLARRTFLKASAMGSLAVLASVFLHGVTARRGSSLYAARVSQMGADMPEVQSVEQMREVRRGGDSQFS